MVMEVFVPSGLALAGVILISGFLRQKKNQHQQVCSEDLSLHCPCLAR